MIHKNEAAPIGRNPRVSPCPAARLPAHVPNAAPRRSQGFWVARPTRAGSVVGPPLGIWRGLVDSNHLVWKR